MVGFFKKMFGSQRMFDTFAHIGIAYKEDTGRDLDGLFDFMGMSMKDRRDLVIDLDEQFGSRIASGNSLIRAHAIDEAVEYLMQLLSRKYPEAFG